MLHRKLGFMLLVLLALQLFLLAFRTPDLKYDNFKGHTTFPTDAVTAYFGNDAAMNLRKWNLHI